MPGIAALLDSDMEDNTNYMDENSIHSASEGAETQSTAPAKRGKKRHRVTMPKPKAKVAKASPPPPTRKPSAKSTATKRAAIAAQMDESGISEDHDAAAADMLSQTQPKSKPRGRTVKSRSKKVAEPADDLDAGEGSETEDVPVVARSNHAQSRTAKQAPKVVRATKAPEKKKARPEPVPETQQSESMDIDSEVDELDIAVSKTKGTGRPASRVRPEPSSRRRAGSTSDIERGDPNLRRRLGDITRKFENVDIKYRNLKEVGISEANANVEKLRKQCEATTEASNNLVGSLKKELAVQAPLANESRKLKKEAQGHLAEIERLQAINAEMMSSLSAAQNEIKSLQAKLGAARSHSTEPLAAKTTSVVAKGSTTSRSMPANSSEALQNAQMKIDLYGDLTGLLVHSVKQSEDGHTYDCIQTGRNGTLHFKLFIDQEDAKRTSFQETEFLYSPLLDANRDRDMMELMPAYLVEEITFARQNAAKFYQRVVETLTRRIADD